MVNSKETQVIAPNFKRRLSGVTSTIIQLVPIQQKLGLKIAAYGPGLPKSIPHLSWWKIPGLLLRPRSGTKRVWHARRNTEMIGGLILKHLFRAPLHLMFTSAAQRHHRGFTKSLIRRMDAVVATSHKAAAYLEVPHRVVMHGIDIERFQPTEDKQALKTSLGFSADDKLIGCFGRVRKQKGVDLFVETMIRVLPSRPGWKAVITGRTTAEHIPFVQDLRQKIEQAGLSDRILFIGEVDNVTKWFQAISLYVAPQRWEGFGLTPLEAMACGVPVVATDVGAFSDLIVPGKTGVVIPREDLQALQEHVSYYMDQDEIREQSGKAAIEHVRQNFPLQREAGQLIEIYQKLLAGENWQESSPPASSKNSAETSQHEMTRKAA